MIVKLLTEHHLEFLRLKGGCTGSSESTLVKMSYCWKSHAVAQIYWLRKQFTDGSHEHPKLYSDIFLLIFWSMPNLGKKFTLTACVSFWLQPFSFSTFNEKHLANQLTLLSL